MKTRTSLFVIGILIAMLAASLLTVLTLFLTGTLAPNKPVLEFTVKQIAAKEYDGTPLTAQNGALLTRDGEETGEEEEEETDEKDEEEVSRYYWESGWSNLKPGHKVEGRFYGSQTDVGISDSDLRVKVYDEKDRDVTSEYTIKVHNCELRVLQKAISVYLEGQQVQYSGKEIPIERYKIYRGTLMGVISPNAEETELVPGQRLIISFPGFENVGDKLPPAEKWKSENIRIYDVAGNDVTKNYVMEYGVSGSGTIEIVPRRIKVRALDAEKYYDGTPISGNYYELVSGTLVEGEFIDDVKFAEKNGGALSATVGEQKVKVSNVVIYRQEGYTLVPDGNYEVEMDTDNYATFTVKARPVTIKANDVEKIYDGSPLAVSYTSDLSLEGYMILDENSTLSMPVPLTSNINTGSNVFEQEYLFHNAMVVKVSEDGQRADDCTGQFDIRYEAGIAKITPIRIQLQLNSKKQSYTGDEVKNIKIEEVLGNDILEESIDEYIVAHKLKQTNIGSSLKQIKSSSLRTICNEVIKNAGTYTFGVALTEAAQEPFGKAGNVVFDATAEFEVEKAYVKIFYRDSSNSTSKVYDGLEAASALDYRNFVVSGNGISAQKFSVISTNYRYTDGSGNPDYGNHTRVLLNKKPDGTEEYGFYTVAVNNLHIINNETSEDVTQNFTTVNLKDGNEREPIIEQFKVYVTITPRTISAIASQAIIDVDSSTPVNSLTESLYHSITFSNLAEGDRVGYSGDDFDLSPDLKTSQFLFSVTLNRILNAAGEDVKDCYILDNEDETIITVNVTENE